MARKISIKVNSTQGSVEITDYDDSIYKINQTLSGSYGGITYEWALSDQDGTDANDQLKFKRDGKETGFFKFSEIAVQTIDGVAGGATNLKTILDTFGGFFFDSGGEMTVAMQTSGGVNFINCLNRRVNIVRVTNGGAATITEIRNVPVGHVVHVFPKNFDLTITKTAYASLTAWQVGGVLGGNTMQSSVGEVFTCIGNAKADGTRYVNQLVANITFF